MPADPDVADEVIEWLRRLSEPFGTRIEYEGGIGVIRPAMDTRRGGVMKGRVVVLKEYGKPFEIEEFDVPRPEPGALLVRITQAGICGSDFHSLARVTGISAIIRIPSAGSAMGHEGTGVVHELGDGVTADWAGRPVSVGDRVIHSVLAGLLSLPPMRTGDDEPLYPPARAIPRRRPASGPTSAAPTATTSTSRPTGRSTSCPTSSPTRRSPG